MVKKSLSAEGRLRAALVLRPIRDGSTMTQEATETSRQSREKVSPGGK
jgi:dihydroxyacid dehydratase/phosphogluconate dehydratase